MIGKILKDILDEKNIKVSDLSRLINVSNQTLYSIIKRDNMKVDLDILIKTCNALDVDIERFYSDYIKTTHTIYKEKEFSILKKYRCLNSIGKEKAETYIDDLLVNPQYTVPDDDNSVPEEHIELKLVAENKNSVPPIVDDITHT